MKNYESESIRENLNESEMNNMNNMSSSVRSSKRSVKCDEKTYLKYRNEELNKEMLEKMSEIHLLKEQIKELENMNQNYKKNFQGANSKIANGDTLKADITILNKKLMDYEAELNYHKVENMRMVEIIHNKDSLITQFQSLVAVSANKFKLFEDTNKSIREENLSLKNQLEEINQKINSLTQKEIVYISSIDELKNTSSKKTNEIDKLENEISKKEENFKRRYDDIEINLKLRMKTREDELKNEYLKEITIANSETVNLLLDFEKLKLENKNLVQKIDNFENSLEDKELEFKRILDTKDLDYEKLFRSLKELQREIKEVEFSYKEKIEVIKKKNKNLESGEDSQRKQLYYKDKKLSEIQNETMEMNAYIEELTSGLKEYEIIFENKECVIKTLKNENSELLKELNNKTLGQKENEEILNQDIESLSTRIKMLEKDKEILFTEKDEDHKMIIELRNKLNENKIVVNKKGKIIKNKKTENFAKEEFNLKEDQYLNEISRLQNIILDRDKERDNMKIKYDKKIHSLKLDIEERENRIQHLIQSLATFKDWAMTMEKNIVNENYDIQPINYFSNISDRDFKSSPGYNNQSQLRYMFNNSLKNVIRFF